MNTKEQNKQKRIEEEKKKGFEHDEDGNVIGNPNNIEIPLLPGSQ